MANNEQIPGFRLPASTGHTLEYEAFRGKVPVAVVFVPEAHTANGVAILNELDRRLKDFGAERSQVLAVVKETARTVRDIAEERGLAIPILADASGAMARDFDAGETENAVAVVADEEGRIKRRFAPFFDGSDPTPAVESLLNTIKADRDG